MDLIDTPETYRLQGGCGVVVFILLANVKAHAPLPAGARVDHGFKVVAT